MRWLGLLPLVVACSHPKTQPAKPAPPPVAMPAPAPTPPPPPPKAPPRLFSEAEISTLEADVLARLAANGKRTCPGPNGTVAGASGPDIIAIVEGTGTTGGCMTRLADAGKDGGLKGDIDARKPAILELDKDCAELFATAVHHASAFPAHTEQCRNFPRAIVAAIYLTARVFSTSFFCGLAAEQ